MSRKTPLGNVKGLGSAKSGSGHWWSQRMSAVALLPLGLWLIFSIATLVHNGASDYNSFALWVSAPFNAMMLVSTILVVLYHSQLGIEVVIEDYAPEGVSRIGGLMIQKFLHLIVAVIGVFSVLKLAFGA
ncbi:MAG: succinate dehydrogenase, hydrophobic membrane anchor protein [Gammaproteobacteria bacterium]